MKRLLVFTLFVFLMFFVSVPKTVQADDTGIDEKKIPVPPSLMLHSHSAEFLPQFLDLVETEGYTTTTYREYGKMLSRVTRKDLNERYIIISIDDFGPYGITQSLKSMVEELKNRGMVAVLSLIVTDSMGDASWDYLKELEDAGFEIASHSMTHAYLPNLTEAALADEIKVSHDIIAEHLKAPVSLVLPYGGFANDSRIIKLSKEAGYKFIVGIAEGENISSRPVYYVGRDSPNIRSAVGTLNSLERRFGVKTNE